MTEFSKIINWDNVFAQAETFQNNKPFKYGFIENIFYEDFYEKLYETYPSLDTFEKGNTYSKSQLIKYWGNNNKSVIPAEGNDNNYSEEWNLLKRYLESEDFLKNMSKFSGILFNKLKFFSLIAHRKGGFQSPHNHNMGESVAVAMFYFSKGWKEGEAGGTYVSSDMDESTILFEPYNLDNSMIIFQDGPVSWHGCRYVTKDVERRSLQLYLDRVVDGKFVGGGATEDDYGIEKTEKLDL